MCCERCEHTSLFDRDFPYATETSFSKSISAASGSCRIAKLTEVSKEAQKMLSSAAALRDALARFESTLSGFDDEVRKFAFLSL